MITEEQNNNNITQKKKKIKNKEKIFVVERTNILNKLKNITSNKFYSHDIETDQEKQMSILAIEDDIKKYFNVSNWSAFKSTKVLSKEKRPLSIVKSVFKDMNVNCNSKSIVLKLERGFLNTTEYNILPN